MASNATMMSSDSQNPAAYAADQRPPLSITSAGRLALIPSLDELMSRRGTKGLQLTLDELTHHHFMLHGYDWLYTGGKIHCQGALYFVLYTGDVHYLGKYRQALDFLIPYAKTGKPNHANRRMR